ncbi:MAG TPA: TIGR03620 family F420-dependent LLM class oxidoreductase [Methylomirabilota bacterium]
MATVDHDALRRQLGRVGVWGALATASAAQERPAAAELERFGYTALWFGEGPATKEAFVHAATLLAATERIVVATGIANIYARDATAMNNAGLLLAEAYPGRFVLGLGVSHLPLVQARGHDYRRPLTARREYLDAMDRVKYAPPPPPQPLPRVLAALRRRMLELARDRTEGAHPYLVTPEHTARARAVLGAAPILAPEQAVIVEPDASRARAAGRRHLALYLTLPNYVNNFRAMGFGDADLSNGGSDRLVDALVAWGDVDAVVERVRQHHAAGADHVAIQAIATEPGRALDDLRVLAPALLG